MHDIFLEQLCTFGGLSRDPRLRVVSTAYMALIDKEQLNQEICPNARWFNVSYKERDGSIVCILTCDDEQLTFTANKKLTESTTEKFKYEIVKNDSLAFDHAEIILTGIERLKNKIEYTDIVFNLMPEKFTLGELKQVYEIILNKKLLDPAFRRIIASKVVGTNEYQKGGGHRPSELYRYKAKQPNTK